MEQLRASGQQLRELAELLPTDPLPVRLLVDTNALIDNPDLAVYTDQIGPRYMAHLLPVVLRELDDKKRAGQIDVLRDAAGTFWSTGRSRYAACSPGCGRRPDATPATLDTPG